MGILLNKNAEIGTIALTGTGSRVDGGVARVVGRPPDNYTSLSTKSILPYIYIMGNRYAFGKNIIIMARTTIFVDHSRQTSGSGFTWANAKKSLVDVFEDSNIAYNCMVAAQVTHVFVRGTVDYPLFTERHYGTERRIYYYDRLIIHNANFNWDNVPAADCADIDEGYSNGATYIGAGGLVFSDCSFNINLPNITDAASSNANGVNGYVTTLNGDKKRNFYIAFFNPIFVRCDLLLQGGSGGDGYTDRTEVGYGTNGGFGTNIYTAGNDGLRLFGSSFTLYVPPGGSGGDGYRQGGDAGSFGCMSTSVELYYKSELNIIAKSNARGGDVYGPANSYNYGGCGPDWRFGSYELVNTDSLPDSDGHFISGMSSYGGGNKIYIEIDLDGSRSGMCVEDPLETDEDTFNIGPYLRDWGSRSIDGMSEINILCFNLEGNEYNENNITDFEFNLKHVGTSYGSFRYISLTGLLRANRYYHKLRAIIRQFQGGGFADALANSTYSIRNHDLYLPLFDVLSTNFSGSSHIDMTVYNGNIVRPVCDVCISPRTYNAANPQPGAEYEWGDLVGISYLNVSDRQTDITINIQNINTITCKDGEPDESGISEVDGSSRGGDGGSFAGSHRYGGYRINGGDGGYGTNSDGERVRNGRGGNASAGVTLLGKQISEGSPGDSDSIPGEVSGETIAYVPPSFITINWFD